MEISRNQRNLAGCLRKIGRCHWTNDFQEKTQLPEKDQSLRVDWIALPTFQSKEESGNIRAIKKKLQKS